MFKSKIKKKKLRPNNILFNHCSSSFPEKKPEKRGWIETFQELFHRHPTIRIHFLPPKPIDNKTHTNQLYLPKITETTGVLLPCELSYNICKGWPLASMNDYDLFFYYISRDEMHPAHGSRFFPILFYKTPTKY